MSTESRDKLSSLGRLLHELEAPLLAIETDLFAIATHETCRDRAERCLQEVRALRGLVANLVPLAREELERRSFDLLSVVNRLAARFAARAEARGVALECDTPSLLATGDSRATEQILSNLLDNALKFTPRGGRVALRAFETEDGRRAVEVTDDGPGLNEEERAHAFEPFYRGKRETPGFGMGLAIARRYAEQQGSTLSLASDATGGARFVLVLEP